MVAVRAITPLLSSIATVTMVATLIPIGEVVLKFTIKAVLLNHLATDHLAWVGHRLGVVAGRKYLDTGFQLHL